MQFSKLLCPLTLVITAFAADPGIWKIAPPPPASWQRDRVADLSARRKALMDQIGDRAVLILYAAEPRNYANDVEWPFRQENDFFYLTGLTQPGATLVLAPGADKMREMVFIPRPVPAQETWTGHMITAAEARETSGIQDVFESSQFNGFLGALIPRARAILATPAEGMGPGRGGRGAGQCSTARQYPNLDHRVRQTNRVCRQTGTSGLHDPARAPQRRRVPPRTGVRRQTRLRRRAASTSRTQLLSSATSAA